MTTNAAFAAAQRSYDNRLPPDDDCSWLETDAGKAWIDEATDALLDGDDQTWATLYGRHHHGVSYEELVDNMEGTQEGSYLALAAARVATGADTPDSKTFQEAARYYKEKARVVAGDLLAKHADGRAEYEREQSELDAAEAQLDAMDAMDPNYPI